MKNPFKIISFLSLAALLLVSFITFDTSESVEAVTPGANKVLFLEKLLRYRLLLKFAENHNIYQKQCLLPFLVNFLKLFAGFRYVLKRFPAPTTRLR